MSVSRTPARCMPTFSRTFWLARCQGNVHAWTRLTSGCSSAQPTTARVPSVAKPLPCHASSTPYATSTTPPSGRPLRTTLPTTRGSSFDTSTLAPQSHASGSRRSFSMGQENARSTSARPGHKSGNRAPTSRSASSRSAASTASTKSRVIGKSVRRSVWRGVSTPLPMPRARRGSTPRRVNSCWGFAASRIARARLRHGQSISHVDAGVFLGAREPRRVSHHRALP